MGICARGNSCRFVHDEAIAAAARARNEKGICHHFTVGFCARGSACRYAHDAVGKKPKPCGDFARGTCRRGDACYFLHAGKAASPPKPAASAVAAAEAPATPSPPPPAPSSAPRGRLPVRALPYWLVCLLASSLRLFLPSAPLGCCAAFPPFLPGRALTG